VELTYRFAEPEERAWMERVAAEVSEIVDFRSMAVVERGEATERGLTQVKGIDGAYPLYGAVELEPAIGLDEALSPQNGTCPGPSWTGCWSTGWDWRWAMCSGWGRRTSGSPPS
jgi:predicted lysophospholipase L1 biosynthesis ABC-type transport system permease subunit